MLAAALTFIIYSLRAPLRADVIFPALSVFQSLRLPAILLPIVFNNLVAIRVSTRRISDFLALPEQPARLRLGQSPPTAEPKAPPSLDPAHSASVQLSMASCTLGWPEGANPPPIKAPPSKAPPSKAPPSKAPPSEALASSATPPMPAGPDHAPPMPAGADHAPPMPAGPDHAPPMPACPDDATSTTRAVEAGSGVARSSTVLRGGDLCIQGGELVAVVGTVGCGKSTLLAASWGEALQLGGSLSSAPTVGIVPQRAFTIAASVLDNISMGRETTEDALAHIVSACALEKDLERLPRGLLTDVGERGVRRPRCHTRAKLAPSYGYRVKKQPSQ